MILVVDTYYGTDTAQVGGVVFRDWRDDEPSSTHSACFKGEAARYEPGAFYRRELPLILSFLEQLPALPNTIIVDGYVTLSDEGQLGLGGYLFEALDRKVAVVGVAKSAYKGAAHAVPVLRGASQRPLFVTALGIDQSIAAAHIRQMKGAHRLPELLKLADKLSRRGGTL